MNEKQAKKLALEYLYSLIDVNLCDKPPENSYIDNSDDDLIFRVSREGNLSVDGDEYVAVSRSTGEVRHIT